MKLTVKISSLIVAILFVANSLAVGDLERGRREGELSLPSGIGLIRETHKGTGPYTVICIEDAHCNFDAQVHIQKIIQFFQEKRDVSLVAFEGSSGELDLVTLRAFPDAEIKKEVFENYARKGEVSGVELSALMNPLRSRYVGIEDPLVCEEQKALLLESLAGTLDFIHQCERMLYELDQAKESVYSEELKTFDRMERNFRAGTADASKLIDFARYLKAREFNLDSYQAFQKLKEQLFRNDSERALARRYRHLELLKNLADLKLSRPDWEYFKKHRREFRQNFSFDLSRQERFYELAVKREGILFENLMCEMKAGEHKSSVLVAGGFHTEGLKRKLAQAGISYVVITPVIHELGDPANYARVMRGKYSFTQNASQDQKPASPKSKELFLKWCSNIVSEVLKENKTSKIDQYLEPLGRLPSVSTLAPQAVSIGRTREPFVKDAVCRLEEALSGAKSLGATSPEPGGALETARVEETARPASSTRAWKMKVTAGFILPCAISIAFLGPFWGIPVALASYFVLISPFYYALPSVSEASFRKSDYTFEVMEFSGRLPEGVHYVANINPFGWKDGRKEPRGWVRVSGEDASPFNPNADGRAMQKALGGIDADGALHIFPNSGEVPNGDYSFGFQTGPMAVQKGEVNSRIWAWYKGLRHGRAVAVGTDSEGNVHVKEFIGWDIFGASGYRLKSFKRDFLAWLKRYQIQDALFVDGGTAGIEWRHRQKAAVILVAKPRTAQGASLGVSSQEAVQAAFEVQKHLIGELLTLSEIDANFPKDLDSMDYGRIVHFERIIHDVQIEEAIRERLRELTRKAPSAGLRLVNELAYQAGRARSRRIQRIDFFPADAPQEIWSLFEALLASPYQWLIRQNVRLSFGRDRNSDKLLVNLPFVLMLNKPAGYVSADRPTPDAPVFVHQLLPEMLASSVRMAGRLDKETTGLMLFSNYGGIVEKITQPKMGMGKTYEVGVQGFIGQEAIQKLESGVEITVVNREKRKWRSVFRASQVRILAAGTQRSEIEMTIHEGVFHQVKKMLNAVGHRVISLKRIRIHSLTLGNLESGKWRYLTPSELLELFKSAEFPVVQRTSVEGSSLGEESVVQLVKDIGASAAQYKAAMGRFKVEGSSGRNTALAIHIDSLPEDMTPRAFAAMIQKLGENGKLILVLPLDPVEQAKAARLLSGLDKPRKAKVHRISYTTKIPIEKIDQLLRGLKVDQRIFVAATFDSMVNEIARMKARRETEFFQVNAASLGFFAELLLSLIIESGDGGVLSREFPGSLRKQEAGVFSYFYFDLRSLITRLGKEIQGARSFGVAA